MCDFLHREIIKANKILLICLFVPFFTMGQNQYKNYKTKESVTKWGSFMGKGNLFTAEILNNTFSGQVFLYKSSNYGFYLTLGSIDDDYTNVIEGFNMIEESSEKVKV